MNNLKIGVLVCAALGLVGLFMSHIGLMLQYDKANTLMILVAFGAAAVMGVLGLMKPPFQRWQGIVALAGFGLVAIKIRLWKTLPHIGDAPTGMKLVLLGTLLGAIVSVLTLAKPETSR